MNLENGKPIDYIKDESGEQKSLYESNNTSNDTEKLVSADDYKGSLEQESNQIINTYKQRIEALQSERRKLEEEKLMKNEQQFVQANNQTNQVNEEFSNIASAMEDDFEVLFGDDITPDKPVPTLESDPNVQKLKLTNDKKNGIGFVSTLLISIISIIIGIVILVLYVISK